MKPCTKAAGLAGSLLLMVGCGLLNRYPLGPPRVDGSASRGDSTAATLILTEADRDTTVQLAVGEELEVVLAGNPSTGYAWEVAAVDSAVLAMVGEARFLPDTQAMGSPGKVTMRFVGTAAGRTELRLVYHRPWEADVAPTATFAVTVEVVPASP